MYYTKRSRFPQMRRKRPSVSCGLMNGEIAWGDPSNGLPVRCSDTGCSVKSTVFVCLKTNCPQRMKAPIGAFGFLLNLSSKPPSGCRRARWDGYPLALWAWRSLTMEYGSSWTRHMLPSAKTHEDPLYLQGSTGKIGERSKASSAY